jgi:hypothetical protein
MVELVVADNKKLANSPHFLRPSSSIELFFPSMLESPIKDVISHD